MLWSSFTSLRSLPTPWDDSSVPLVKTMESTSDFKHNRYNRIDNRYRFRSNECHGIAVVHNMCVARRIDGIARQKAFLVFTAIMSGRDGEWNNLTTTNGLHWVNLLFLCSPIGSCDLPNKIKWHLHLICSIVHNMCIEAESGWVYLFASGAFHFTCLDLKEKSTSKLYSSITLHLI